MSMSKGQRKGWLVKHRRSLRITFMLVMATLAAVRPDREPPAAAGDGTFPNGVSPTCDSQRQLVELAIACVPLLLPQSGKAASEWRCVRAVGQLVLCETDPALEAPRESE